MRKHKKLKFALYILVVTIASIIMGLGISVFISPNKFLSTGFTGIAIIIGRLVDNIFGTSLETTLTSILYFAFNVPLLILSIKKLSPRFTILSIVSVIVTAATIALVPNDLCEKIHLSVAAGNISFLDAALFVGLLNGVANSFCFIVGGSAGGTDILSMYFNFKKQVSIGKITIMLNAVVLVLGIFVDNEGNGIAKAFYTLVYLLINSIVIDLFYVRNKRNIVHIITTKGKEISEAINTNFYRGVTEMDAVGTYTGEKKQFLYCACSYFEVHDIIKLVMTIDEHAFVSVVEANRIIGNFANKNLR